MSPMRSGFWHQLEKIAKARAAKAKTLGLLINLARPLSLAGGVAISLAFKIVMRMLLSKYRTIRKSGDPRRYGFPLSGLDLAYTRWKL